MYTAPAQTNEEITNNNNNSQNLKLYPIDFTASARKFKTFNLIARTKEIMNTIQGPAIMDINIANSNDINLVWTNDGTNSWLNGSYLTDYLVETVGFHSPSTSSSTTDGINISLQNYPKLKVRRDGENANAMTGYDFMTENYDQQASRVTSNAPSDSLYSYPFIFSNYTIDPALRPLCIDPLIKWYWTSYSAPSTPPQVSVLKVSTLNSNINTNTVFPSALTMFPVDAVAVDCSSLSTTTIGKLYKLSPYIIDVSNTHEGLFNAVSSGRFDSDIGLALDHTLTSQDIEFGLFLSSLYLPTSPSGTPNARIHTYKYDPVEAIFSYFSTRRYENTDNCLNNIALNTVFKHNIILSNRIAVTYLMQQAAKQMRIWISPANALTHATYTTNEIADYIRFNIHIDFTNVSSSVYTYWPQWIPYEYVSTSNPNIDFDQTTWVSGRGNRKVAKHVVKPRSFIVTSGSTFTYYNKFGESLTFNLGFSTVPISIYVPSLPGREIYTIQTWNNNNMLSGDYLENSDYFPREPLETNL